MHKNWNPRGTRLTKPLRVRVAVAVEYMALVTRYNPATNGESDGKMTFCCERWRARSGAVVQKTHDERSSCLGGMRTGGRPTSARRKSPLRWVEWDKCRIRSSVSAVFL